MRGWNGRSRLLATSSSRRMACTTIARTRRLRPQAPKTRTTTPATRTWTRRRRRSSLPPPPTSRLRPRSSCRRHQNAAYVYFHTATPHDSTQYAVSIKPRYTAALDAQAEYLVANPTALATVYGSTDTVGAFKGNLDLAARRRSDQGLSGLERGERQPDSHGVVRRVVPGIDGRRR